MNPGHMSQRHKSRRNYKGGYTYENKPKNLVEEEDVTASLDEMMSKSKSKSSSKSKSKSSRQKSSGEHNMSGEQKEKSIKKIRH